jgi:hypothetical protein
LAVMRTIGPTPRATPLIRVTRDVQALSSTRTDRRPDCTPASRGDEICAHRRTSSSTPSGGTNEPEHCFAPRRVEGRRSRARRADHDAGRGPGARVSRGTGQEEQIPWEDEPTASSEVLSDSAGQVIPWLDQPAPNPIPANVGNLLQWEELDSFLSEREGGGEGEGGEARDAGSGLRTDVPSTSPPLILPIGLEAGRAYEVTRRGNLDS